MTTTVGSVATAAWRHLDSPPDAVSGLLANYADESVTRLNNMLGTSITGNNIGDQYANVLIHMTAAKALGRMTGVGADFSYTVGDFSVDKGGGDANTKQLSYHLAEVRSELPFLKSVSFRKVNS